jgi:hypothetical protein
MRRLPIVALAALLLGAQSPTVHRLEATPLTIAYGYYWSEAKPVLRIASGDILDVDTLLTSTPDRLEKAGVPAGEIQPSLRAIVDQVKDRGLTRRKAMGRSIRPPRSRPRCAAACNPFCARG